MCMITYIPANVPVPEEGIKNGAIVNDDGHGWAVASAEFGLEVGKSMTFEVAFSDFKKARERHGIGSLALFHSRIATHGTVDTYNVHPFYVGDDFTTVVAHNGILPSYWHPFKGDARSDTRVLADRTLPNYLTEAGVPSRRGGKELGRMIGYNKLVILSVASGKPKVRIVNADLGYHSEGAWFSNDGYQPCRWSRYTYGGGYAWGDYTYGGGYSHGGGWDSEGSSGVVVLGKPETTVIVDDEEEKKEQRRWGYYPGGCDCCASMESVEIATDICTICGACTVCFEYYEQCECPGGGKAYAARLDAKRDEEYETALDHLGQLEQEEREYEEWLMRKAAEDTLPLEAPTKVIAPARR